MYYWKTYTWTALFLVAAFWPGNDMESIAPPIPHLDKWAHFIFSAGLAALLVTDVVMKPWMALLVGSIVGGLIEIGQRFSDTGRSAEWGDLAADITGVLAGVFVGIWYLKQFGPVTRKSLWRCFFPK